MRQMADNNVGGEARVDEKRRIATPDETNVMEAGKMIFLFQVLEISILHYLQNRVLAPDATEVGDEKQTRNFLQSEKSTAFDCDPRNHRKRAIGCC